MKVNTERYRSVMLRNREASRTRKPVCMCERDVPVYVTVFLSVFVCVCVCPGLSEGGGEGLIFSPPSAFPALNLPSTPNNNNVT